MNERLTVLLRYAGPILVLCSLCYFLVSSAQAFEERNICIVYFNGIGCPRCAKYDPIVFDQLMSEHPNLVVINYEIYRQDQNAPLLYDYNAQYDSGWKIPLMIIGKEQYITSGLQAREDMFSILGRLDSNECPLIDGSSQEFSDLDPVSLPGYPRIWYKDKILIKTGDLGDGYLLKNLLFGEDMDTALDGVEFQIIEPVRVELSGKEITFENAILVDDWIFQWHGQAIGAATTEVETVPRTDVSPERPKQRLALFQIVTLAAVDAINPCAFAVLILMLTTVITYNPGSKKTILLSGLAFVASVFILYFLYGLVIIRFFQVVQALTAVRLFIFKGLGVAAMVFGVLNIRDFVKYKPGRLGTEMPLFMRPRVHNIITKITSIKGAFLVGVFVTVFLLPCTIGPYVIAGGILSVFEMLETVPPLLLYNLVFVLPMLAIVGGVYLGLRRVEDLSSWKERNIGKLHLMAGILMFGIGIAMFLGLV